MLNSQTSIVFSLEEGPGILFKALAVFALRQINLSKVSCLLRVRCNIFYGNYICFLGVSDCTFDLSFLQIESRPLRNQPLRLRAQDDNNGGYSKYKHRRL